MPGALGQNYVARSIAVNALLRVLALALLPSVGAHAAQSWPARTIVLVAPAQAGGAIDLFARLSAEGLARELGRSVLVENRPGAGTNIGNQFVAQAKPDGHTLLLGGISLAINPHVYKNLPYDPIRDLLPVRLVARMPNVVVVSAGGPVSSVSDLVRLARANPGRFNYASPGSGTSVHLAAELFKAMTETNLVHVPYKSSPASAAAVLAGEVLVAFENMPIVLGPVKAGKLRALAVTTSGRSPQLPDVPTLAESGVKGYDVSGWFGLLAPAGTPPEIVRALDGAARRALSSPETRDRIYGLGAESVDEGPEAFAALIRSESAKWGPVIRKANVVAD
jgi:tripartite-type tricarboxylate transporter receptor subunit TctC